MAKKLAIVIHRETNEAICIKSKTDLASFLEVSLSTVIRKYNDIGMYQSGIYTIYIGVEYYQSDKEKNYKHDVVAPTVNTYDTNQRQSLANKAVRLTTNDQVLIQEIEQELDDDTIIPSQYDQFYSTKTLEELLKYRAKWSLHPTRMVYIIKYGKLRQGVVD